MPEDKRFFWMKLNESFFEDETIAWLEEQTNGKEYVLFLLKLCLKSLKTNGILMRAIGNIFIPYDVAKLAEMTRTDVDTVAVAMQLFQKIGIIEILEDGAIYISILENMVGSETKWAKFKRNERNGQKQIGQCPTDVQNMSTQSIENKSKEEKEKNKKEKPDKQAFTPPTLQEVQEYCKERGNRVDPQRFIDFYEAKGWMIGKNKMKDWKAAVRTWERQDAERTQGQTVVQRQGASAGNEALERRKQMMGG